MSCKRGHSGDRAANQVEVITLKAVCLQRGNKTAGVGIRCTGTPLKLCCCKLGHKLAWEEHWGHLNTFKLSCCKLGARYRLGHVVAPCNLPS